MRHLYRCPMRWADLDLFGHVNNVTYVDYLQEARVDMMRALGQGRESHDAGHDLGEGVVVVRHEVTYLAPLGLRFRPVSIECWVTDVRAATFTMAYEVFHEEDDGTRRTYLRATTVLTPYVFAEERPRRLSAEERAALTPYVEEPGASSGRVPALDRDGASHYPLHVRFSDVDLYRHVNNVKYFEYFQEARIRLMADLTRDSGLTPPPVVVAQTDVDYLRPILLRPRPYDVWSRVTRVGTRSMTIGAEIDDGQHTLARSRVALVFWDPETERSTEPDPALRALVDAGRTGVAR